MQGITENLVGVDAIWQLLGLFLASAVPFIESYFGSAIGVVIGLPVIIAILVASLGNIASMVLLVTFGEKINGWRRNKAEEKGKSVDSGKKNQKLRAAFDKWGIAGVSLLGQTILPSQITSMAMVSFGADRKKVIFWQIISIILWGTAFGLLTHFGVALIR